MSNISSYEKPTIKDIELLESTKNSKQTPRFAKTNNKSGFKKDI